MATYVGNTTRFSIDLQTLIMYFDNSFLLLVCIPHISADPLHTQHEAEACDWVIV